MIGCGIGVGVARPRGLAGAIRALFNASEKGVWYDPSDFSTLYQDSAGTTPVTAVGDPVGLVLDKSQGLVLGAELVTNGGFDTDTTGWSSTTSTIAVESGRLKITNAVQPSYVKQNFISVPGRAYRISYTAEINDSSAGTDAIRVGLQGNAQVISNITPASGLSTRDVVYISNAASITIDVIVYGAADTVAYIDNISVRELPGNHATQSTSTARPIAGASLIDFDGVDDAVITADGGGGTTGFFLCAAVRPDGGAGAARTIFSDAGTNTGYILRINASNQLELSAGNGTAYTPAATTDTLSVGTTYVVTAWDDGTNLNVQVNSGTAGTAARPVVSAGTAAVTIGKDNGAATGLFNGVIYPLVYVKNGQNVDAADRAAVKSYVASKAGVSL